MRDRASHDVFHCHKAEALAIKLVSFQDNGHYPRIHLRARGRAAENQEP
jgi:HEPN domain-containing protein